MKKIALASCVAAAFICANVAAETVTASATATWDASATKDTKSALVVTPLKSLSFKYAEGIKAFNSQSGAFDITIEGQAGATDFTLTSQVVTNTLSRTTDDSTLSVGVDWNGKKLNTTNPITLVDVGENVSAGLDALAVASAYGESGRTSTQGNFTFTIDSAKDGDDVEFSELADGYWSGDVKVQFNAVWTI
ncbi:common pilus major fimbrillin subunit EcpA [Klebsiella sp. S69]|uniref:common pilus major fimbrillin subunit EcpA n=1 Tax=Klebsiella sp. S69 TaxID=2767439 RepID=UPI001903AA9C|nr:common pilus major fimbrillin subunit EcpA [Klebsiella sp. S69]MBK0167383.1 fimbrial protein [Klebsiella sp. S69]